MLMERRNITTVSDRFIEFNAETQVRYVNKKFGYEVTLLRDGEAIKQENFIYLMIIDQL